MPEERNEPRGSVTNQQQGSQQQPKEEPKKSYRVKEGMTWGSNPTLQAGETVELTEKEAAGFLDLLELVEGQLESETGKDFTVTGSEPPTLSETDNPAPKVPRKS